MITRVVSVVMALFTANAAQAGTILSEEVSVTQRDPLSIRKEQVFLIDDMDVRSLSPAAKLLALPRPMITRELAGAMRAGKVQPPSEEWQRIIRKAARLHDLPEALIAAVIRTESSYQAEARSAKGAQGAMQIMPETQRELGLTDPFDPEANVLAGCAYLKRQLVKFGSLELALAAYNAGPSNVLKYGGIPPFPETRDYISRVTSCMNAGTPTHQ